MRLQLEEDSGTRLSSNDEAPLIKKYYPPRRILIVDDDFFALDIMKDFCEELLGKRKN